MNRSCTQNKFIISVCRVSMVKKKNINLRLLSINLNKTNENIPQKRRHKLIARTNCFLRVRCWLKGTQYLVQSLHTGEGDRVLKRHPIIPRIIRVIPALSIEAEWIGSVSLTQHQPFRLGWVPIVCSHYQCARDSYHKVMLRVRRNL